MFVGNGLKTAAAFVIPEPLIQAGIGDHKLLGSDHIGRNQESRQRERSPQFTKPA